MARSPAESGAGRLVLDRYRLERPIGRGGHGVVWEAFDEHLEREVAVKAIPRGGWEGGGDPGLAERAEREGRIGARLGHPGIVTLYELGSDSGHVYLVSELVHGRTVAELAAAGALSDRDVERVGVAICSALAHAHVQGVIHRDVKPQNVIVVAEPAAGAGFAKLTDFGVAHLTGDDTLTITGDVVGTLAYMAPEQAEGGRVTAAADVYSLALLLYEGWTDGGSEGIARARLAGRPLAPLRRLRPDLPPALCEAIDRALDPLPDARPELEQLEHQLRNAGARLSSEGGLVEPAVQRRFGITSAARARRRGLAAPSRWLLRAAAGLAAAGLVAAAIELLVPGSPVSSPAIAAAGAGAVVAVLPRVGWILAVLGLLGLLALSGREGTALVLFVALAPTPLLLPRAGYAWSVPALAPLLGAAGLALAFPALAGLASTVWRRAGLALAGFVWLLAAELLAGRTLFAGPSDGVAPPGTWSNSLLAAAGDAIEPVAISPAPAPALLWAALAVALPLAVRGRSLAFDLGGVLLWALALTLASERLAEALGPAAGPGDPAALLGGASLGGALAVGASAAGVRRWREERSPSRRMIPEGPVS